jgi:methylthioribose-1-phosphate isomerase
MALTESTEVRSIDWIDGAVELIDQTRLPEELVVLRITTVPELVEAIKRLAVRGAPSIGVAGALGVALAARAHLPTERREFASAALSLRNARPTAVNLGRAVDRAAARAGAGFEAVLAEALLIRDEEIAACWEMGRRGADLLEEMAGEGPQRLMTICNTGGLAAVERGTALGVIATMFERGLLAEALAVETRPLLQGSRLTTWELRRLGAPHRLIVDSAGPFLLATQPIDAVLIGADRVAANGDTANKVGSFALALGAQHAGVPFIVVAPESSIDFATATGADIEIEDRGRSEVIGFGGREVAPPDTDALNPSFDVTPVNLITALVTDRRVVRFDRGDVLEPWPPDGGQNGNDTEEEYA